MSTTTDIHEKLQWSVKDVARFLGVGVRTVWRWSSKGVIPEPVRWPGRTFWQPDEVREAQRRRRGKD